MAPEVHLGVPVPLVENPGSRMIYREGREGGKVVLLVYIYLVGCFVNGTFMIFMIIIISCNVRQHKVRRKKGKEKFGANAMKRVAAGAHLPTPVAFCACESPRR